MNGLAVLVWALSVYVNYRIIGLLYQSFTQQYYKLAFIGGAVWVAIHQIIP